MKKNILACLFAFAFISTAANAQKERNQGITWSSLKGLDYEIKAGFNVGGVSPIPLPEEIRATTGYKPTICLAIEGNMTKWLDSQKIWGVAIGLKLENKGMEARSRVKNYGMEITDGRSTVKGVWTGRVRTKVRNSYFSIPVLAKYRLSSRVNLSAGSYVSFLTNGDFSGDVYEGYLREDDPTGSKVIFDGDTKASYDFSDNLRKFQWGIQAGAQWRAFKHLNVYADLTWGLNDAFENDFKTIAFAMYPIYLNVGFGYAF